MTARLPLDQSRFLFAATLGSARRHRRSKVVRIVVLPNVTQFGRKAIAHGIEVSQGRSYLHELLTRQRSEEAPLIP